MSKVIPQAFKAEEIEVVTSSGRKYHLRQLDAADQMDADCMPPQTTTSSVYYRTALAITAIDGEEITKAAAPQLLRTQLKQISGTDMDELVIAYVRKFAPQPVDLKNA